MSRPALALLVPLCLAACGSEPAGQAPPSASSAAQTASVEVEGLEAHEPALAASASAPTTEAHATLSGSAPPVAPSAKAPNQMSEARASQLSNELAQLDVELLSALNEKGTVTDNVLKNGEISSNLIDSAAGSSVGSGSRPGSGELRGGSGQGINLADLGGGSGAAKLGTVGDPGAKLAGKSLSLATSADLEKAVADAGCSSTRLDSPSKSGVVGKVIVLAKCADKSFTITFVPTGAPAPDATTLAEMSKGGAHLKEGDVILAVRLVSGEDSAASKALLDKLVKRAPKGNVRIEGATVTGGDVSNASAVVAGMAAGLRRCYNRGLNEDPTMQGSLKLNVAVGPNGEVLSATPVGVKGLSGTVASCAAAVASSRSFDKPGGGSATITIPVSFMPAP
ncbi:MAG: AgmX/PglI C-terminal domain-containing protein [Polyangiaceae bacterium]|nr:AgmX/PglI C-terminal domain-containing protein [Polyangiaceae bacterium]